MLRRSPRFAEFLPYNSVQRRNVGFLYAAEIGAEVIVSIDDDIEPVDDFDFVGEHGVVGTTLDCDVVSTSSGWFNTCSLLETSPRRRFYHRGYPVAKRWVDEELTSTRERKRVVVNVGLWLGDPDVDSLTRIEEPFQVIAVADSEKRFGLASKTYSPFNSQNTAFHRHLLPCLYLVSFPAGESLTRYSNNFRYDDIWMSYFMKVIVDHMDDMVCVGPPHVRQRRNEHDFLLDVRRELAPMEMTNRLADLLPKIELTESTYRGAYQEMIEQLRILAAYNNKFPPEEQRSIRSMLHGMQLWADLVSEFAT